MVNEVALILLGSLLGWQIAAIYLLAGISIAIAAGFIIDRLHPEQYLENLTNYEYCHAAIKNHGIIGWSDKILLAKQAVFNTLRHVWVYVILNCSWRDYSRVYA